MAFTGFPGSATGAFEGAAFGAPLPLRAQEELPFSSQAFPPPTPITPKTLISIAADPAAPKGFTELLTELENPDDYTVEEFACMTSTDLEQAINAVTLDDDCTVLNPVQR